MADLAGQPVEALTRYLPGHVNRRLRLAVRAAIYKCLEIAIGSLDPPSARRPSEWAPKLVTGFTGAVGGFFGLIALPVITTFMLRSICEIARAEGEDLTHPEAMLACLECSPWAGAAPRTRWTWTTTPRTP